MGLEAPKTKNTATLQDRYDLQGCGFVVYASVTVCLFCFLLPFGYWQMTYLIDFLGNNSLFSCFKDSEECFFDRTSGL